MGIWFWQLVIIWEVVHHVGTGFSMHVIVGGTVGSLEEDDVAFRGGKMFFTANFFEGL